MEDTDDFTRRVQRAVVFAPDGADLTKIDRCLQWVRDNHYVLAGIVSCDFAAAQLMLTDHKAEVLVIATTTDVPPRTIPRWEVVSEQLRHHRRNDGPADPARQVASRLRRPRPL